MRVRRMVTAGGAAAAAVVLSLSVVSAAGAATYSGSLPCSGTRWALVHTDAKAPGNGRWTKYSAPTSSHTFTFPGGASDNWGYYQADVWQVTATGFYSAPSAGCY